MKEVHASVSERGLKSELRNVFFAAMQRGYAARPRKGTIAQLPGSKTIPYVKGPWDVIDTYITTNLSEASGGMTCIYHDCRIVWMMQYMGEYDTRAIPCLKAALRDAYTKEEFWGGRGSPDFVHDGLIYTNRPYSPTHDRVVNWNLVAGREEVRDSAGDCLGWHQYSAMLMRQSL
jgi:hypothetical protein